MASFAGMAELADAIDLGSIGNTVQVQVLLPAPLFTALKRRKYVVSEFLFSERTLRCALFVRYIVNI